VPNGVKYSNHELALYSAIERPVVILIRAPENVDAALFFTVNLRGLEADPNEPIDDRHEEAFS